MGSGTASQEWFKVWRTIAGEGDAPQSAPELEVLVRGPYSVTGTYLSSSRAVELREPNASATQRHEPLVPSAPWPHAAEALPTRPHTATVDHQPAPDTQNGPHPRT